MKLLGYITLAILICVQPLVAESRIFVLGYPNSGNHLTLLLTQYLSQRVIVDENMQIYPPRGEWEKITGVLHNRKGPFIHRAYSEKELQNYDIENDLLLLVVRNPLDCIISSHALKTEQTKSIPCIDDCTSYFENFNLFEKWSPKKRAVIYYEDLISNPISSIKKLGVFLRSDAGLVKQCVQHQDFLFKKLEHYRFSTGKNVNISDIKHELTQANIKEINQSLRNKHPHLANTFLKRYLDESEFSPNETEQRFDTIYVDRKWGDKETVSGFGSRAKYVTYVKKYISEILKKKQIFSVLDVGCGDLVWMKQILKDFDGEYFGIEASYNLTNHNRRTCDFPRAYFISGDASNLLLPKCDLIICRDVLVHLTNEKCLQILDNFKKSGAKYLLTTHFPKYRINLTNNETPINGWRPINLCLPPFNFGEPLAVYSENYLEDPFWQDKSLALWKL